MLDEGRKELQVSGLAHKKPQLMQAEYLADVRLGREFDYIWAFSVLIHLKDDILAELMRFVAAHLGREGVFYANVDTSDAPDAKWQEFPGVRRPLNFYAEYCDRNGLQMSDIGSLADFGHVTGGDADQQRMLEIRKS